MRLLICTQAVDKNHPALGFFHRWLEEFAKHCDSVEVVCLEAGEHNLPSNVHIHTLGKETRPTNKIGYSWRLLVKAFSLRGKYDAVFVHMIPEYVLAGAPVWFFYRKPINLWYTHGAVSWPLRLANLFVRNIFTADKVGMNLNSSKIVVTGHGIDMEQFDLVPAERNLDLLTVGRITASKNIEELISVLAAVRVDCPATTLTVIGKTGGQEDERYLDKLKSYVSELGLTEAVKFIGPVKHSDIPKWLMRAKVFVHSAKNGSLDKVLLEALAAKTPVVSSAIGAQSLPLGERSVDSTEKFSHQVISILKDVTNDKTAELKEWVKDKHCLRSLVTMLVKSVSSSNHQ